MPCIHRRYWWWRGMLKGGMAGTSPTGPWTDERTGVRTPDDDERHPWRILLDRPCLLCYLEEKLFFTYSDRCWLFISKRLRRDLDVVDSTTLEAVRGNAHEAGPLPGKSDKEDCSLFM